MAGISLTDTEVTRLASSAVSLHSGSARPEIILICEHGGQLIPEPWNRLGLHDAFLDTHFAHDIGSRDLTLGIAHRIGATAVISNYSRLYLDYNRKPHDDACMRLDMGGIPVPGNLQITDEERHLRERIARHPVERVVSNLLDGDCPRGTMVVSLHSFSPVWDSRRRTCEIGVMWKQDARLPLPLIDAIAAEGQFRIEDNQPYSFKDNDWFTLDRHGLSVGIPNAYIEVRNDLIGCPQDISKMAGVLASVITSAQQALELPTHPFTQLVEVHR